MAELYRVIEWKMIVGTQTSADGSVRDVQRIQKTALLLASHGCRHALQHDTRISDMLLCSRNLAQLPES